MLLKSASLGARTSVLKPNLESISQSNLYKTVTSSPTPPYSNWVQGNQLFQRHPRLEILEQRCTPYHSLVQILSYIFISGLHRNPFVMSRILYLSLIESKEHDDKIKREFGIKVFNQIDKPNTFSWNTMIRFFADSQNAAVALRYYRNMLSQQVLPDKYTFPFLVQACGASSDLGLVKQVHCHLLKLRHDQNLFVQNSFLNAYLLCGSLADALSLFDEMLEKDVVSWTTLISRLVTISYYREAIRIFKKMMVDDCASRPNVATMVSVVSACGNLGSLDHTQCVHALLLKAGWLELHDDVTVANSLIDAYGKCGSMKYAAKIFKNLHDLRKDLYTWTAIISGYAMHGQGVDAVNLFYRMEQVHGLIADDVTLVAVLSACAHSGLVKEGLHIFESMTAKYSVEPNLKHYGCIVDLLGRAGILERAYSLVEKMPMEPNLAILGSLLSASRLHNKVELGEAVLKKIQLLSERGGAPVLLSNMYANENQWDEVIRVRKEMREGNQDKPPGMSWIQIRDEVHEFVAGTKSHQRP